jgi:hypothetical protein
MSSVDDEVAVRYPSASQCARERRVLEAQTVCRPRVEPDVGVRAPQRRCLPRQLEQRAVERDPRLIAAEDRMEVIGEFVARPALQRSELSWVVQADIQRAVATLGEAAERAA